MNNIRNLITSYKHCLFIILCYLIFISCQDKKKNVDKIDNKELNKNQISNNSGEDFKLAPIDFLEEKYKINRYRLPGYSPAFPNYSFLDKKNRSIQR
ncbi:hypothetical protein GKZ90_0012325 [Flavobacterium sp. MC2016-06]|jgi:hypothetical protein|uniref:hypothetical protein n=1 Tax=Flavobacterium sp. MC2016-06 TaxID=2676308 RepID=UPI0012BB186D|nr:hypothetical protein [Flavobacterium sp. MC2016-06]MBU3862404.1 hypothetical protein [Flavobacterium sp. MC2016-06]